MKKLILMLGAMGAVVAPAITLVSCDAKKHTDQKSNMTEQEFINIMKENKLSLIDGDDGNKIISYEKADAELKRFFYNEDLDKKLLGLVNVSFEEIGKAMESNDNLNTALIKLVNSKQPMLFEQLHKELVQAIADGSHINHGEVDMADATALQQIYFKVGDVLFNKITLESINSEQLSNLLEQKVTS